MNVLTDQYFAQEEKKNCVPLYLIEQKRSHAIYSAQHNATVITIVDLPVETERRRGGEEETAAGEKQSGRGSMSKQEEREDGLSAEGETLRVTFAERPDLPPPVLLLTVSSVLLQESERLEMLNSDLKAQIEELKMERQQLILMLNRHRPTCIVRTDSVKSPESESNPFLEQLEDK